MPPGAVTYESVLEASGFARHAPAAAGGGRGTYRRAARAPWVIEARPAADGGGHLDLGLTLSGTRAATLVGPVHRALSPAALAAALADITASLEALADAAERLRCPDCNGLEVLHQDEDGPFLACGQPRRGRKPFHGSSARCRRNLVMAALVVYGDER